MKDEPRLPYDSEIEKCILGAVIMKGSEALEQLDDFDSTDLFSRSHQCIFKAMWNLHRRGDPVDLNTVKAELRSNNDLEVAGGSAYLSSLIDGVPHSINLRKYAAKVKEKSAQRQLVRLGQSLVNEAGNGTPPHRMAEDFQSQLASVARATRPEDTKSFAKVDENHYRLDLPSVGVRFSVDRLRRDREQLKGELAVECDLPGARTFDGILNVTTFNLSSTRTRSTQAKHLAKRARTGDDVDWSGMLEEFCQRVLAAERQGDPSVSLRDLPRPEPDETLTVQGLPLLAEHPVIWFGDGGTVKSYLALWVIGRLAQRGKRVGFFDWELSGADHRDRLERLFGEDMPEVRYARCSRPFIDEVDRLYAICRDDQLDYAVFDSIAFACDGPPEDAEVAGRYFQALRQLGTIGSLHIAHVSKAKDSDQKPFGSAFWFNGARSIWNVKREELTPDDSVVTIALHNRKANLGPIRSSVGLEADFSSGRTTFRPANLEETPDLAADLSVRQRMALMLRHGAMDVDSLAQEIDAKPDTIRRTARRYSEQFTAIDGGKLGLLERTS